MNEYKVGDRVLVETDLIREGIILKIVTVDPASVSGHLYKKFYKLRFDGIFFFRERWFSDYYIKGVIEP
jgi:hypothetical protein